MQHYYDPQNLSRLKTIEPFLHYQLEHISSRIYDSWYALISNSAMPAVDSFLISLDLIELTDNLTELCKKIKTIFIMETGKPFFNRIDEYNLRQTKITLAVYDELYGK